MTLSRPQISALRYVRGRRLFATDVNEGNGNRKRSILWLLERGMLDWDPICNGHIVLTAAGIQALAVVREIELAEKAKLGVMDKNKLQAIHATGHAARRKLHSIVKGSSDVPSR